MNIKDVLHDWGTVNDFLPQATEAQALKLLNAEKAEANRLSVLLRLYGRYNKLRAMRERSELLTGSNE